MHYYSVNTSIVFERLSADCYLLVMFWCLSRNQRKTTGWKRQSVSRNCFQSFRYWWGWTVIDLDALSLNLGDDGVYLAVMFVVPLASSNTGSPQFSDLPSINSDWLRIHLTLLCACSENRVWFLVLAQGIWGQEWYFLGGWQPSQTICADSFTESPLAYKGTAHLLPATPRILYTATKHFDRTS